MDVEALFPLSPVWKFDTDFHKKMVGNFIQYAEAPRKLTIRGSEGHDGETLTVQVIRCSAENKRRFFKSMKLFRSGDWLLSFRGTFNFPGADSFVVTSGNTGERVPIDELPDMWQSMLPHLLDLSIQTYLCALRIAFPGAVDTVSNIWLINGRRSYFTSHYRSVLHESVEFLVENGVQPREDIDPQLAIAWVFRQNGMVEGYSDTPAARALNYFTRLFVPQFRTDELSNVVWALAGIEALLVEGGRSSGGQLREKLAAIFALRDKDRWLVQMTKDLYEYRSKMVHGNRQLKSEFRSSEEDSEQRLNEQFDSSRFAVGVLLMLIQECIVRNLTAFQFRTVCC